jgi:hypothetical protein
MSFKYKFAEDIKKRNMYVFEGAVKNLKLKTWCAIQECWYISLANRGLLNIETHLETATQMKIV